MAATTVAGGCFFVTPTSAIEFGSRSAARATSATNSRIIAMRSATELGAPPGETPISSFIER
jgi:hypothetical protein